MNKTAFLKRLGYALKGLPKQERDDIISDYDAHFREASAQGRSESETAAALGAPEILAAEYLKDQYAFELGRILHPIRLTRGLLISLDLMAILPLAGMITALIALIVIATIAGILGILLGGIATLPGISATLLGLILIVAVGSALIRHSCFRNSTCPPYDKDDDDIIEREISWTPNTEMVIALGAEVHWRPGREARAIVRGAPWVLEHLRLDDGRLHSNFKWRFFRNNHIRIDLQGPPLERWQVIGSGALHLHDVCQTDLELTVEGSGDIRADGSVEQVCITIKGTGDIDIGTLEQKSTTATVIGMGDATIAPTETAILTIEGSGDIRLQTEPAHLETKVTGSGDIRLADGSLVH